MDEDSSIRVLHFHNPHLLWIEVKKQDTFVLRQVGLFGVVPRQASVVDGERVCTKSDHWDPRANEIVEEFLEAKSLCFKSTYRLDDEDNPTSLFEKQPHIFGEIYSLKSDGVKKQLVNSLDNSVYAYKSKNEFWQMLNAGKIKTNLGEDEAVDVLKKIKQHYQVKGSWQRKKEVFLQHLTPTQVAKLEDIPSPKLTMKNLKKHQILTSKQDLHDENPMDSKPRHRKYRDINYNSKDLEPVVFLEDVIKKFTVIENKPNTDTVKYTLGSKNMKALSQTGSSMSKITVYDEEICTQNSEGGISNNASFEEPQKALGRANTRTDTKKIEETKKFEDLLKLKEKFKRGSKKTNSPKSQSSIEDHGEAFNETMTPVRDNETKKYYNSQDSEETSSNASPCNGSKEKLIAYGPPMNNLHCLVRKKIKITDESQAKSDEDTVNVKPGNINWDDDNETNFDKSYKNPDNVHEKCNKDLNETNNCNVEQTQGSNRDFVKSKLEKLKDLPKLRGGDQEIDKKNDTYMNGTVSQNSNVGKNKENINSSSKNCKSKLLEIMRKRAESKHNDSLSSTDSYANNDHSVKRHTTPSKNADSKSPKDEDSDIDDLEKINAKLNPKTLTIIKNERKIEVSKAKIHVNPYKNLDGSKSVFVDNLVEPLLLAHSKNDVKILPQSSLRDIPFKIEIHNTLRNMQVKAPSRLQSVTWPYILRGHSMIMISATGSGKTLGYLPAVCNLVLDYNFEFTGLGPVCIIVCATALSVNHVANECKMFLNHQRVLACFSGLDNTKLVTDLINGCDVLVSTPSALYRLLQAEIGVDLRRLTTLVFEDCERLSIVYELEVKAIQLYVKQMLKTRTDKQVKVQYILASRKWCDFMNPIAKKAPDTIITFTAFHECVLYSKVNTSVSFVKKEKKVDAVIEFLKVTDESKLAIIVCRTDDEVEILESRLKSLNFSVVACNNQMTIHDLYKLRTDELSSILICCDDNLNHLNIRYANYLVHYSMPALYTQFCARFAVLNERYPTIFGPQNEDVKIKILLEDTNVEQLPKILNFVKRCSSQVPEVLNDVARMVLERKDLTKAEKLIPICDSLLTLGECADMYSCQERHAILKGFDEPKAWMPTEGIITFNIIHYNSAVSYSARLLTHTIGDIKTKYPETYGTLCMKLGMFFSKEKNKRLHGEPKVGDICAVPVRKNFIARCQVLKIIDYEKDHAKNVIINIIDEEQITVIRAVELYHLPEQFKATETHVVKVRLANIRPQDKDVTFSVLARNKLKKITDDDEQLYLKGRVVMTVRNTIFVDTLEACTDLSALCETVVKHDFKNLLLDTHAIPDSEHLPKLQKLCDIGQLKVHKTEVVMPKARPVKRGIECRWAHLDKNDWSEVIFTNTINPGKFFVSSRKFSKCADSLISDIKKYVEDNPKQVESVSEKDIVLAEWPDDSVYERAMIEKIIDDTKVTCFFVDNADWRDVAISKLKPIPQKFIKQIPFQSIECRLIGIKPPGEDWTEFSSNWLHDNCLEDNKGYPKRMYVKYYTKENAEVTGGHKYGVVLVDTTTEDDLVINKRMLELNLAAIEEKEYEYLEKPLDFAREKTDTSSFEDDLEEFYDKEPQIKNVDERRGSKDPIPIPIKLIPYEEEKAWESNDEGTESENDMKLTPYVSERSDEVPRVPLKSIFAEKPIRSFPLVADSDEDSDKWDVCIDEDLGKCFGLPKLSKSYNETIKTKTNTEDRSAEVSPAGKSMKQEMSTSKSMHLAAITDAKKRYLKENNNITGQEVIKIQTAESAVTKGAKIIETEGVVGDMNTPLLEHSKNKTEFVDETDNKYSQIVETNAKEAADILDNGGVPMRDTDILKGEIKDVSIYDSDDTLSITSDKTELKKVSVKKWASVLDSDDTQSILTENEKETEELKNKPNKSLLDSDDSDTEDHNNIQEEHQVKNEEVKTRDTIHKVIKIVENMKANDSKVINETTLNKQEIEAAKFDSKTITITEIPKADPIDQVSTVEKTELNKTDSINAEKQIKGKTITITATNEPTRTPQLVWRQNKNTITIKIKVVVDDYTLETGNKSLKFSAYQNEVQYAFDIELYGVIDSDKTEHWNKGQYILVKLVILLKKSTKWLKLSKEIKNWIIYDIDSIDTSSDEETPCNDDALKIITDNHEKALEFSDEDDDDMDDTSWYRYRVDDLSHKVI